jgi:F0F1-type ATP synthase delta subunit
MKKHYINAVTELLLQGKDVDVVLADLAKVLKAKGHMSIHGQILEGVRAELQRRKKSDAPTVTVASNKETALHKDAIEASLTELGGSLQEATFTTDETLIGGYVVTHKGKLINRSYKEKLISLYRSIIA